MDFKKLNTQLLHHTLDKGSRKGNKTIDSSLSRLQQINIYKKDYEKQLIFNMEKTVPACSDEDICLYETISQRSQH